jgi:hypothetical protein
VASWLGIATMGLLWPLALIWAFLKPAVAVPPRSGPRPDGHQRPAGKEVAS